MADKDLVNAKNELIRFIINELNMRKPIGEIVDNIVKMPNHEMNIKDATNLVEIINKKVNQDSKQTIYIIKELSKGTPKHTIINNLVKTGLYMEHAEKMIEITEEIMERISSPKSFKKTIQKVSIFVLFLIMFGYISFLITAPIKLSDNALLWLTMGVTVFVITIPIFAFVSFDEQDTNLKIKENFK